MRSLLERAIVHLLNGDEGKASALLHKFMVERARQIHESLRQNDDVDLTENWDQEIRLEEYFDDADVNDDPSADPTDEPVDDGAPEMADDAPDMGDAEGVDSGDGLDDQVDDGGLDDMDGDADGLDGEDGSVEDKIDTLSGKIDDFMAEFDRVMAEFSDEEGIDDPVTDDGGLEDDGAGGDDAFGGDEDLDNGDAQTDNKALAGRMETDVADPDEDNPEDEIPEDAEMGMGSDDADLDDITESVLAELDKVAAPANTDGRQSDGKSFSQNKSSVIRGNNNVMDRKGGEPVMTKAKNPARGYARETPPSSTRNNSGSNSKVRKGNVRDHWEETMEKVPAEGPSGALLNTDFASGHKKADSIIPGKKDNSKL